MGVMFRKFQTLEHLSLLFLDQGCSACIKNSHDQKRNEIEIYGENSSLEIMSLRLTALKRKQEQLIAKAHTVTGTKRHLWGWNYSQAYA
jgi:hypothetical protein